MYAALSSILIITISVVVPIVVLFILGLVIIVCTCLCYKYKPLVLSSKVSLDRKTQPPAGNTHLQSSQPTQPQPSPVYETVMECNNTTVDLEMTENVAYAPIHTRKKNVNNS